jgi:hypothetical protein
MKHNTIKSILPVFLLVGMIMFSGLSYAAPASYVGVTFVVEKSSKICTITSFGEGFSLSEADALYATLTGYMTDSKTVRWSQHMLPSENLTNGITPESLLNDIAQNGTGACLIGNQPVNQLSYTDIYKCTYQGTDHTCMDFHVHTGTADLSAQGIPHNMLAEVGAIAIAEPVWDAAMTKVLTGPPQSPQTLSSIGMIMKDSLNFMKKNKRLKNLLKKKKINPGLSSK